MDQNWIKSLIITWTILLTIGWITVICIGCTKTPPNKVNEPPKPIIPEIVIPEPVIPEPDPFKEQVKHYIQEVRVGAKLLTTGPPTTTIIEKHKHIVDLYTRLPDIDNIEINRLYNKIHLAFEIAIASASLRSKHTDLNTKIDKENLPKIANGINKTATELENLIGEFQ